MRKRGFSFGPILQTRDTERMRGQGFADPRHGKVVWRPVKSVWISTMTGVALVFGPMTISWPALAVFVGLSAITLCAGHSVGMHRLMIHRSFECPLWLERALVYLGVLVGMAGPRGMMAQHDIRDWAQRQPACHPYLRHGASFWTDYLWQCHGDLVLDRAPTFRPDERFARDPVLEFLERTWMAQQVPLAIVLYLLGGWAFVVWGIAVRVSVCVTGHWLIGHFAHHSYGEDRNAMSFEVADMAVQGRDVPLAGLISMGEAWHNNHHAFPTSAKMGVLPGQVDLGWLFISVLRRCGLAWDVKTPEVLARPGSIIRLPGGGTGCPVLRGFGVLSGR
ncbi:MAG: acyl-CoA desaturase [Pseudomonadota bacterium]